MSYQDMIEIGDVLIPVIIDEEGAKWYPIRFICDNVLLREGKATSKLVRDRYRDYVKKLKVNFDMFDGGVQETNCININGFKEFLSNSHIGRLSLEQRKAQNKLLKYFSLPLISERVELKETISQDELNEHDAYVKDIIETMLKDHPFKFRLCSKCSKYYPLHENFYSKHPKADLGYTKMCYRCLDNGKGFKHPNEVIKAVVKDVGEEYFVAVKEGQLLTLYEKYLNGELRFLPDCYHNKEDYIKIIDWLYENKYITENNLSSKVLCTEFKLIRLLDYMTIHQVYTHLYGDDYYLYPWKYPQFRFNEVKLTYDLANQIFDLYLQEHNIVIEDIFTFDYADAVKKARIRRLAERDIRYFAVQYHGFKYAGYMFKITGVNYYRNRENLKFDFKYLIENDLKIPPYKIPIYITKYFLAQNYRSLSHVILSYRMLFEVVNDVYPDLFTEDDFKVSYIDGFDSDKEYEIDQILRSNFRNVIYNQRGTDRTIVINRNIPDWFVMTENGVWIVEYFGMYVPEKKGNSWVDTYLDRHKKKHEKYKLLDGYKFLYLYIEDTENNLAGVKEKIKMIK